MAPFDLPGVLRRIRRTADLSQRELAQLLDLSKSSIGRMESGAAGLDARVLARAATIAGLRLALIDDVGDEVAPMTADAVRDGGDRRFPAHLDTRHSDEGWWHGPHRYDRSQPWYTFDRDRVIRDRYRARTGPPDDHQLPQPGDSPQERAAARKRDYWRRRAAERQRAFLAGELSDAGPGFVCDCPPGCDELDLGERPVHVPDCPCSCDLG